MRGLAIFLVALLGCSSLRAEGLRNLIPKEQKPILKVYPASEAEKAKKTGGRFVLFTREEVGKEWDFLAGAWECFPDHPDVPVTKRVEFCHSSWNADTLLDGLAADGSEGRFPRYVRLQVDEGDSGYRVNLYDIDYRSWDVRCIWQGRRLAAFGELAGLVFCRGDEGWFALGSDSGVLLKDLPFEPVEVDGQYWIVRKAGTAEEWSYDPAARREIGEFRVVERPKSGYFNSLLSEDGRRRGILTVPVPDDWSGGILAGSLILQRSGELQDIEIPIEIQASQGSGVPVIPLGVSLQFSEGALVLSARKGPASEQARFWSVDLATGEVSAREGTYKEPEAKPDHTLDGVPVPEALRATAREFRHFGRKGLAPAFLMHIGMLLEKPEFDAGSAGVSPDGRRILYAARSGPLAGSLIYGDVQTGKTVTWKLPEGLKPYEIREMRWVD